MTEQAARATSRDVARAAGVSQATVSLVLGDKWRGRVSERTAGLVRDTARDLDYRPNLAARNLRARQEQHVAGDRGGPHRRGPRGGLGRQHRRADGDVDVMLRTMPGIGRPAIAASGPRCKGVSVVLDLGANDQRRRRPAGRVRDHGRRWRAGARHRGPTVGLLNIGAEEMKGHEGPAMPAAFCASAASHRYYGFVEGDDIAKGTVDVVVTDGFTGNVALKTAEGVAKLLIDISSRGLRGRGRRGSGDFWQEAR